MRNLSVGTLLIAAVAIVAIGAPVWAQETGATKGESGSGGETQSQGETAGETPSVTLPPDPHGICAVNGSPETLVFTAESSDGSRMISPLKPGEWFCISSEGDGTVGAYLSEDVLEGCTRLAKKDQPEILLQYHDFDRCLWEGNKP